MQMQDAVAYHYLGCSENSQQVEVINLKFFLHKSILAEGAVPGHPPYFYRPQGTDSLLTQALPQISRGEA